MLYSMNIPKQWFLHIFFDFLAQLYHDTFKFFFIFDWMWVCCERITAKHKALKMNTGKKKISRNENEIYITSDLHFNFKINMLGFVVKAERTPSIQSVLFLPRRVYWHFRNVEFLICFKLYKSLPAQYLSLSLSLPIFFVWIWYICYVLYGIHWKLKYQIRHSFFLLQNILLSAMKQGHIWLRRAFNFIISF